MNKCTFRADAEGNTAVGVTWAPSPFGAGAKWSPLLRHMLAEQLVVGADVQEGDALCFDRLLLGRSQNLDWCAARGLGMRACASYLGVLLVLRAALPLATSTFPETTVSGFRAATMLADSTGALLAEGLSTRCRMLGLRAVRVF